ncbi:nuclear transport factor 2 family protein [Streptomyces sp. NP160]|uniref:nuclear transport factor 2 family protein n=1 Tax=Streptomyces sp. NP160 TaxID=2586637 RepID=UPI001117F69A|nr:nuclear transport factor 2 family protein [Streptomyces sp. NP160]TNM68551.1 nuclear transport factor 2 family protein [Streptomyces sp. NP160]
MTNSTSALASSGARRSLDLWLTMWNTDGDLARQICAHDFRIRFAVTEPDGSTPADEIRSSEDFVRYLRWWHEQNPGTVFTRVSDAVDADHGRLLWDVESGGRTAGGVDVFDFDHEGRVSRVWSVGGQRSLRS